MKFTAPKGFALPDGVKEGEEFDVVATMVSSGGQLMVKAVEGLEVSGGESEAAEEDEDEDEMEGGEGSPMESEGGFLSAIEQKLAQGA